MKEINIKITTLEEAENARNFLDLCLLSYYKKGKKTKQELEQNTPSLVAKTNITAEEIRQLAMDLKDKGKIAEAKKALQELGCDALEELPKEKYIEFAQKLKELGAKV